MRFVPHDPHHNPSAISRRAFGRRLAAAAAAFGAGPVLDLLGAEKPDKPTPKAGAGKAAPKAREKVELLEYTELRAYRLRVSLRVGANEAGLRQVTATCAVPVEWPEQKVRFIEETKSPGLKTRVRDLVGLGAVLTATVPTIRRGDAASVERLYEVRRFQIALSRKLDPAELRRPQPMPPGMRVHLGVAQGIEVKSPAIVDLGKSLRAAGDTPWAAAREYYDWVRANVAYEMDDFHGAQYALEKRVGDCEDMTALFIALCRGDGIPARSVWIEGHAYPEFYLQDPKGNGAWIPVQACGPDWFGRMIETRVILQKGDSAEDPVRGRRARYLPHSARAIGGPIDLSCVRTELPLKERK